MSAEGTINQMIAVVIAVSIFAGIIAVLYFRRR